MIKKIKILLTLPADIYLMLITYLPGSVGYYLRFKYWRKQLKFVGEKVRIDTGVYFQNPEFIEIDDNCWIDKNVIILAGTAGPFPNPSRPWQTAQ